MTRRAYHAAWRLAGALLITTVYSTVAAPLAHAGSVTPMPVSLKFPDTGVGAMSASMNVQLTNTGMMPVNIDTITIGGANAGDFVIGTNPAPILLGMGVHTDVDVVFAPMTAGPRTAILQVQVRGEMTTTNIPLSGTALGPKVSLTPSPLVIGGVLFGQNVTPLDVTVSNGGGSGLHVASVAIMGMDAALFSLANLPAFPQTLGPMQSFTFQVNFAPVKAGQAMTTLVVTSDDPMTQTLTTPLTGYTGDPKVALSLGSIFFGNQRVGQATPSQDVDIINGGYSPLTIQSITLGGANAGDFNLTLVPKLPVTLAVGKSVKMSVAFTPTAGLKMTGTGTTPMAMVSPGTLDFGAVRVNAMGTASFNIKNTGTGPVLVTALVFGGPDAKSFSASLPAPFTVQAGNTTVEQITFTPTKVATFSATCTITTDDPNLGMASVILKGSSTSPSFSVSPMSLDFGTLPVGDTSMPKSFTIKNTGNQALTVKSLLLSGPGNFAYTVTQQNGAAVPKTPFMVPMGAMMTFNVVYKPKDGTGDDAQIVIGTDDPMNMSGTVVLSGTGAEANISTLPANMESMDFGKVGLGATSKPQGIKISNNGTAPLVIAAIKITDMMTMMATDAFAVDTPQPFTIAVGASQMVLVTFSPKMAVDYAATLEIDPADMMLGQVTLTLTGTGTMPMITALTNTADNSLDFGMVPVGMPSPAQTITVHNGASSSQPVVVAVDKPQFAVDQMMVMVPAMGNATVSVTFTPDAEATFQGKVTITLPGAKTAAATIVAKGQGQTGTGMGDGGTQMPLMRGNCGMAGRAPSGVPVLLLLGLSVLLRRRQRR